MSIKTYCDVCGQEFDGRYRMRRILGDVMIEVMVRCKATWNSGHVCDACVLKVANDGRPAKEDESWIDDTMKEHTGG